MRLEDVKVGMWIRCYRRVGKVTAIRTEATQPYEVQFTDLEFETTFCAHASDIVKWTPRIGEWVQDSKLPETKPFLLAYLYPTESDRIVARDDPKRAMSGRIANVEDLEPRLPPSL